MKTFRQYLTESIRKYSTKLHNNPERYVDEHTPKNDKVKSIVKHRLQGAGPIEDHQIISKTKNKLVLDNPNTLIRTSISQKDLDERKHYEDVSLDDIHNHLKNRVMTAKVKKYKSPPSDFD